MLWLLALCSVIVASGAYNGVPFCSGGRDVIVHLFEWKWTDIQNECSWLAANGYCAVQVSPPQEHAIITSVSPPYPWWQRYQPVSYQLSSRSGNDQQFRSMVSTCNSAGVYIHVDAVIQHMTGGGSGTGSGGSSWNGNTESYPGVPYGTNDFHKQQPDECTTESGEIENYGDAQQVRFCRLVGLRDLRTASMYVRGKIRDYMNNLISIGVAGFRVDACKHTMPTDLENIYNGLNNLNTAWFPSNTKPFIYQEVIDLGGESVTYGEYIHLGRVTEFKHSGNIGNVFRKWDGQRLAYLQNWGEGWGFMKGVDALVFIDNHDNQRGHGPGGASILTYKDAKLYKMATAFELAWPYGMPRVMSSFAFSNTEAGPPSDGGGNTNNVNCFDGNWICEHRWRQIYNMAKFHNAVLGTPVLNWWDNGNNQIAFGRGSSGFIIINNEGSTLSQTFSTAMPAGEYCDIISCDSNRPPCGSCRSVLVSSDGSLTVSLPDGDDPVIAIHV